MITTRIFPKTLYFRQPAGTSRGIYTERKVWYVWVKDRQSGAEGVGECAPLPRLSCDDIPDYEPILRQACAKWENDGSPDWEALRPYPSMTFGLETAYRHLQADSVRLFDTPFTRGEAGIQINGLIWMGTFEEMFERIREKIEHGYACVKLKIGAIDFELEMDLLRFIRSRFSSSDIELRVDANGAFRPEEALERLEQLSCLDLHSIEQPIRAGQPEAMRELCRRTPLPIALDEELIGINQPQEKAALLDYIAPHYLILKPSLHGGLQGAEEWIRLAEERHIGYWATSALESNVGLNAIAQWCSTRLTTLPQGLGTGQLFRENIEYPLYLQGDRMYFRPTFSPDFSTWFQL